MLSPAEWDAQTIANQWKVKDVVAHLLDGNFRILSIFRDGYFGEHPGQGQDLVTFLNDLNADWIKAMRRASPQMLIFLHEVTGTLFCNYFKSLDPFGTSVFPVAWAGESESKNWMEIAREYTEKWLHQQQIREVVNKPSIMTRQLFHPFIKTFMMALPHTYQDVVAADGTSIKVTITSAIGGSWFLVRANGKWILHEGRSIRPSAEVIIDPPDAWKLFSKSVRPHQINDKITIKGDRQLAEVALNMVAVMA